jgi:hypothetical protein
MSAYWPNAAHATDFVAGTQPLVVTAAGAQTSTTGSSAGASASNTNATTAGGYYKTWRRSPSSRAG